MQYVLRGKQYLAMIRPLGAALCLEQMRYADEVLPADELAGLTEDVDASVVKRRGSARAGAARSKGGAGAVTDRELEPVLLLLIMVGSVALLFPVLVAALLFSIGVYGVLARRNAILVLMAVELMLNAANLALVAFAWHHGSFDGQVASFFVMVVAAAEVVVGLAIIVSIYKTRRSTSVDNANLLNQ